MARLAGEAGLRRAEVAQAHRDDLIADRGGWSLIVKGKGGKQRVVPLTDDLAEEIRDYKGVDQADTLAAGYLFPGKVDGHISVVYAGQLISVLMPPGWSMHKLRHRAATRGHAGTGNLRAVQEFLGHASVATTQRYVAVSRADVRRVSEAASAHVNGDGDRRPPETTLRTLSTGVLAQCVPLAVTNEHGGADLHPPHVRDCAKDSQIPLLESGAPSQDLMSAVATSGTAAGAPPQEAPKGVGQADTRPIDLADNDQDVSVISMADVARCEVATLTTHHGAPCTRRANWQLDLHGCKQILMCERDIQTWKRHQLEALYRGTRLGCVHCGQSFECFDDVCSITRL
jgi:hypothetical protein